MTLTLWMMLCSFVAQPSGQVAYVADAGTPSAQVRVLDVAQKTTRSVGPGSWDGAPQWSPDGAWLAFETGDQESTRGLYVVRADGREGRALPLAQPWNTAPRWSTDGTRLTYVSSPGRGGLGRVGVYDLNGETEAVWGGNRQGLVRPVWMPFNYFMLMLDPDSSIAVPGVDMERFITEARMGRLSILRKVLPEALVALQLVPGGDGGGGITTVPVMVTASEVLPFLGLADPERAGLKAVLWQLEPNWEEPAFDAGAPTGNRYGPYRLDDPGEGNRIAYESDEGGDREIFVLGRRGIANVTNHRAADWNPVWSPEGRRLAFESFRDGPRGIYQVFTDTALVSPLAVGEGEAWSPAWSPDGKWVAFVSDRTGVPQLYVVSDKGKELEALGKQDGAAAFPAWRPEHDG